MNAYEVALFETVGRFVPEAVPAILGHDPEAGLFAMTWLDPAEHTLWKTALLAGEVDVAVARAVGERLGRIHAATAAEPTLAVRFLGCRDARAGMRGTPTRR